MHVKKLCAVLAVSFASQFSVFPVAEAETIQAAIQKMIDTHPDVRSAIHNRLARDQEVRQARAGYFPTVDFEAGVGRDYVDKPFDDDMDPRLARLGLRQNIFAGLSTKNEVERQKARVESQAYLVRSTADNMALKVADVYLDVLKYQEINKLANENLLIHQRIADQIQLRNASGIDSRADMDQIQSRLNLAQAGVVVSEQNLLDAQTAYNAVIGSAPTDLHRPDDLGGLLPPTMTKAEELALATHPQLKSAQADLQARRAQEEVAKSPFMPIVDFEADQVFEENTSFNSNYDDYEREDLRLFLRLRYNLFNGWKDEARKLETMHLVNEAQEIRNHTHRQVVESTRLSWRAHEAAKKQIDYLTQRLQFAANTARAYTMQWNIGQRTLLDVLDAEAERIDSARQLVTAEYDGLYAQYRILNSTGQLIPALHMQWPKESATADGNSAAAVPARAKKS